MPHWGLVGGEEKDEDKRRWLRNLNGTAGSFRVSVVLTVTGETGCPDAVEWKLLEPRKPKSCESSVRTADQVMRGYWGWGARALSEPDSWEVGGGWGDDNEETMKVVRRTRRTTQTQFLGPRHLLMRINSPPKIYLWFLSLFVWNSNPSAHKTFVILHFSLISHHLPFRPFTLLLNCFSHLLILIPQPGISFPYIFINWFLLSFQS